mmetsp:Transcript_17669/g.30071  ORF Transcript_17669/g.30071 Transcript_17669/m.30071 type:complete len:383 (-) Transcript_17669:38-1186(-)
MDVVGPNYKKALLDNTFAELFIKIGKETLSAHRGIVAVRCEEICPLPDLTEKKKKIKDKTTVTIKSVSNSSIFMKVLEFLYSGSVNFATMTPEAIMELNKAAKIFNLKRLSYLCEDFFQQNLSLKNVFDVLVAAHKLNEPTVKSFCKFFAIEHFNEFVMNTEGLHILGIDLFQECVTAYLTAQATGNLSKVSLGESPPDTLIHDLERLYKMMPYADCKFIIEGTEVLCHKGILGAYSDKFKEACKTIPPSGMPLNGISLDGFRSMLKYLYYGDDNIEPLPACELVGFARNYGLTDLLELCENKIRNSIAKETVIEILEVAYQPEMASKQELVEELKSKTFPFVAENFKDIDLSPLRMRMSQKTVMIAADLILYLQDVHRKAQ